MPVNLNIMVNKLDSQSIKNMHRNKNIFFLIAFMKFVHILPIKIMCKMTLYANMPLKELPTKSHKILLI